MGRTNLSRFLQSQTNVNLCRSLGWQRASAYLRWLGKMYYFYRRSERRTIVAAVESAFTGRMSRPEQAAACRRVFDGIVSHYYEKLFNVYASVESADHFYRTHIESSGLAALRKGLAGGNGVLLITGHYGGVEFIPGFLSVHDIPVSIVVKFSTDELRNITLEKAKTFSTKIIDADRTPNIMKAIFADLKSNRVVVTQCDEIEEWRPSFYETVSFLRKQTYLDRTMNILIKRGNAPVVLGLMHRKVDHRYRFIAASVSELCRRFPDLKDLSPGAVALRFLERFIFKYPHAWYQWKKYHAIPTAPAPLPLPTLPAALPLLRPV